MLNICINYIVLNCDRIWLKILILSKKSEKSTTRLMVTYLIIRMTYIGV